MTTQQATKQRKINGYAVINQAGDFAACEASAIGGSWNAEVWDVSKQDPYRCDPERVGSINGNTKEQAEARAIMFAAMLNVTGN